MVRARMSSLLVESPGFQTTVQDLGREGYGALGVSPSGAADPVALRIGNLLLDNPPGTPALEMTLTGGIFAFPDGAVVCLAGADFGAQADGRPLPPWKPWAILPGQRLSLGSTKDFARSYLCIAGVSRERLHASFERPGRLARPRAAPGRCPAHRANQEKDSSKKAGARCFGDAAVRKNLAHHTWHAVSVVPGGIGANTGRQRILGE